MLLHHYIVYIAEEVQQGELTMEQAANTAVLAITLIENASMQIIREK